MRVESNGTLAASIQNPDRKTKPDADNDAEKLKQTLKDGNGSVESNRDALTQLRDLYKAKIDDNTASDGEKTEHDLIRSFLGGNFSADSISNLASSLGISQDKLKQIADAEMGGTSKNGMI